MFYILLFFLLPIFLIGFLFILFLPYKFTINSIIILLRAPKQLIKIATNLQLRRNHALEHATINVLEERYGCNNMLSGWATEEGFYINGNMNPIIVEEAAREGLARLQQGQNNLVIHKRCGTSMVVAHILSALIFLLLLLWTGNFNLINMLLAIFLANILGPRVGSWVQRRFTTSDQVQEIVIDQAYFTNHSNSVFGFDFMTSKRIFVKTKELKVYY